MKKILLLLAIAFVVKASLHAQTTKRVLWIGNSYTYVNDLPTLTNQVANSMGDTIVSDGNLIGGATFALHTTNATTLSKIAQGNWNYVVLQEQSQIPSFPDEQVEADMFPFAAQLNDSILAANPCTETMFYMTWGRKNGDAGNCPNWPPVCTYEGMDSLLRLRYLMVAQMNQSEVSAVGAVWKYLRANYPQYELYSGDGSHPSLMGSYAAACCFYTSIFRKDPTLIPFNSSLDPADAANIKAAVKTIVFDHFSEFYIGNYDPIANFTSATVNDNTISFTNNSINNSDNTLTYLWSFGDGATSNEENPVHSFATSGEHTVTLLVSDCIHASSYTQTVVTIGASSATDTQAEPASILLYPNPTSDKCYIALSNIESLTLTNALGQKCSVFYQAKADGTEIDASQLQPGTYQIEAISKGKTYTWQLLKR